MSLLAVVGMQREAKLLRGCCEAIVAGSDNSTLAMNVEAAIANGARAIISFGICGALSPELAVGTVVVGTEVVSQEQHWRANEVWSRALEAACGATNGIVVGSDSILLTATAKADMHRESGAIAADMESHIVARVASACGVPFAVLRAISDDAHHALPPAAAFGLNKEGSVHYSAVFLSVLDEPSQIGALIRTARDANAAMASLRKCVNSLGPTLACPYS